jgi:hypothetical protein
VSGPVDVFLSYALDDEPHARALEQHLVQLKRDQHIRAWHQRLVAPGTAIRPEIDARLRSARIIVLLASPSYLASDYLYEQEMMPALSRARDGDAVVIPVLIRAHDWEHAPYGQLAVLPSGKTPVDGWTRKDDAWTEVIA